MVEADLEIQSCTSYRFFDSFIESSIPKMRERLRPSVRPLGYRGARWGMQVLTDSG